MSQQHHHDAAYAAMCSSLGLSARDLAEIGDFSERFARDLLSGRRSFPKDIKKALFEILKSYDCVTKDLKRRVSQHPEALLIYRTNDCLRSSAAGESWPPVGAAKGGFAGPHRAAMFEVWRWLANERFKPVTLMFADQD